MSLISKIKANKKFKEDIYVKDPSVVKDFISTGCIPLNLQFSGKLNGGIPLGKISMLAAPSSLGKTFVGLKIAKNAQKKGMEVIYLDTEFSFDYDFADSLGIDEDKILVYQNNSIEEVQQFIMSNISEMTKEEKAKILIIIDSFNGLVTSKTFDDAIEGKDVSDMTKSKKLNNFSKLLMGQSITVFIINQVYDTMNQYDPFAIPGGRGVYFASTSIVLGTSKAKDKDSTGDINGAVISTVVKKSRLAKEHSKLKYVIKYDGGIHPVMGIEDDLQEFGFVVKPSNGWYQRDFNKLGIQSEKEDKKWRMGEIFENWKEFFEPILKNEDVIKAFEEKYSFAHSSIVDEEV